MYTHKIISDIYAITSKKYHKDVAKQVNTINNAEVYYFGNISGLSKHNRNQMTLLDGTYGENFRLPFKLTTFEIELESSPTRTYRAAVTMMENILTNGIENIPYVSIDTMFYDTTSNFISNRWQPLNCFGGIYNKQYHETIMNLDWNNIISDNFTNLKTKVDMVEPGLIYVQSLGGIMNDGNVFTHDKVEIEKTASRFKEIMPFIMAGLKLLSCKNVVTRKESPPEKLNKKRKKNNKPLMKEYRKIYINPTGTKTVYDQEVSVDLANHVTHRPGHFKTYSKERPLFGKYHGTWWWSPIVNVKPEDDPRVHIVR